MNVQSFLHTVDEISTYIGRPDCFVWVALKDPAAAELEKMQREFGLHPLAVEDAQRHDLCRPRDTRDADGVVAARGDGAAAGGEVRWT